MNKLHRFDLLRRPREVGCAYCYEYVCLSVRLHNSKIRGRTSPNFYACCTMPVARYFSDGVAIRYVLPVFGHMDISSVFLSHDRRQQTYNS